MPEPDSVREGGCLCGAVRYQVIGEPRAAGICHCNTCRRVGSAPSLPFATFDRSRFGWRAGEAAVFPSSEAVLRRFCGRCGSPLTYESTADPAVLDIMVGSLDAPESIRPRFHVWVSERIAWDIAADGLPAHARSQPPSSTVLRPA